MGGVDALVHLIICHGMEHLIIHPAGILTVNNLPHQPESRLHRVCEPSQLFHKLEIENIGAVQTDPVDIKLPDPEPDRIQKIVLNLLII